MSDTSNLSNGALLERSSEAAAQVTTTAPFGDTAGTTINVSGITVRERMVQQLKTLADKLAFSLRSSTDPAQSQAQELDLTRAVEAETATAKQDAEEASLYLGQVSHDIRSRMTSILGYADLLLDTSLTDDQSSKVRNLREASASLLLIINDLLDISALGAGQLQLVSGPVNLQTIVDKVRSTARPQADSGALYLRSEIGPDVPAWVNADAARLTQVLLSLVVDGLKSTLHGGVRIAVTTAPATGSDKIRFEVINTGTGIPLDQQENLFRPFSRSRYSFDRPSDGTGMNLAVSKRLVEAMGGTIGVGRPADGGSICWFELPLVEVAAPAIPTAVEITPSHSRSGRILVAEDLPMNQMVIKEILEADGHQVTIAGDGIAAINAMNGGQFDLILMDVAMPAMGGLETAQALRALDGARSIPILALTAHAMPMQIAACRAAGMDDFLAKPFDREVLVGTVRRWLDRRPPPPVRALRVLVADDVLMNRDIADSFLRAAGYTVTCVASGAEAVAAAAASDFDVVLMDVRMPEMDGLEATHRIRALEGTRGRVPVVALTADAFTEQVANCYKAGMVDHLSKPFNQETLVAAVLRAAGTGHTNGEALAGGRPKTADPDPVANPLSGSEWPIRDPIAFENTAVFLAPEAVEVYLKSISDRGESLLRGLRDSEDLAETGHELAEAAHGLAGSAGMFGFARLDNLGRRFEWAVKRGTAEAPVLANELEATVSATIDAIHNDRGDWAAEAARRGPQPG
jgi:CheY-like chemotaxis protein/signal transduction histidine kinase/HPt (histidine-containing phosphotransfer) domain-containing protein